MSLNNYTHVYEGAEASEVAIDLLVGVLVGFVSIASIFAIWFLITWMHKKLFKKSK